MLYTGTSHFYILACHGFASSGILKIMDLSEQTSYYKHPGARRVSKEQAYRSNSNMHFVRFQETQEHEIGFVAIIQQLKDYDETLTCSDLYFSFGADAVKKDWFVTRRKYWHDRSKLDYSSGSSLMSGSTFSLLV